MNPTGNNTSSNFNQACNDYFHPGKLWHEKKPMGKVKAVGTIISYFTIVIPIFMKLLQVGSNQHETRMVKKETSKTNDKQRLLELKTKEIGANSIGKINKTTISPPSDPKQQNLSKSESKIIDHAIVFGHVFSEDQTPETLLKFYDQADQVSFWDSYLDSYQNALKDPAWDNFKGLVFLNEEMLGIKESLESLQKDIQNSKRLLQKKKKKGIEIGSDLKTMSGLENQVKEMKKIVDEYTFKLQENIQKKVDLMPLPPSKSSYTARGFANAGNTCYINSALQPLLAIGNFANLVPDNVDPEPAYSREERQNILNSFKVFLNDWKEAKPANELGRKIGELRRQIFQAGLLEGGFVNQQQEYDTQDTGSFFELILHVIGRGFKLEITKTPLMDDGRLLSNRTRTESTEQGVFYLQLPGNSVQEIVDGYQNPIQEHFTPGNEWRVEHPDSKREINLPDYMETNKIAGPAPQILVVRVNNRVVDPDVDSNINFAALFKDVPENSNYKLVGFAQNIGQYHWKSIVLEEGKWKSCNDSVVKNTNPSEADFKVPANYMVYVKT